MACALALFLSPWVFPFALVSTWSAWICGYAMLTVSLAALVGEADWEPQTNLWLGIWTIVAPWLLNFSGDSAATLVHVSGGGLVALLSAVALWKAKWHPPWRFQPGAACRPEGALMMSDKLSANAGRNMSVPILARRVGSGRLRHSPHPHAMTASVRDRKGRPSTRTRSSDGRARHLFQANRQFA
jgi:hypothetical protein